VTLTCKILLIYYLDQYVNKAALDQITRTIEIKLLEALGESDIPEPIRSVRKEYIM